MNRPLRGVNLGGWLVLEPWLTPSLFAGSDAKDEYTYCMNMDESGLQRLRKHQREFITEADFKWLSEQGIEAVRLPVGYWLFGDVAPFLASFQFVDRALKWAATYNLLVLIDVHGAPGSQNGEMHSGQAGAVGWTEQANIDQTVHFLVRLAKQYGRHPALLGISFLNEPSPKIAATALEVFYHRAYQDIQPHIRPGTWLVFSDGFRPLRWRRRLPMRDFPDLYVDYHHYQIFSWLDKRLLASWQLWRARHRLPSKLRRMARKHPVTVGEWSVALRSEKTEKLSDAARQRLMRTYQQAQLQAFASSAAWFYWTYKTETAGAWSFQYMIDKIL